jgi:methyl-accepting chemotaxis protein
MAPSDRDLLETIAQSVEQLPERVRAVESSTASAHHRLDHLTGEMERVVTSVHDLAVTVGEMNVRCEERSARYAEGLTVKTAGVTGRWAAIVQLIVTAGLILGVAISQCGGGGENDGASSTISVEP